MAAGELQLIVFLYDSRDDIPLRLKVYLLSAHWQHLWSVCSSYSVHSSLIPDKIEHVRSPLSSSRLGCACTLACSSLCLFVVPSTSQADYLADNPTTLTEHPYFEMFVFDKINCVSRRLSVHFWSFGAEDVVLASLASSHCHAFVAAVADKFSVDTNGNSGWLTPLS